MDKVKVYYHRQSDRMDVWFDDPGQEVSSEEVGDGTILKKTAREKWTGSRSFMSQRRLEYLNRFLSK